MGIYIRANGSKSQIRQHQLVLAAKASFIAMLLNYGCCERRSTEVYIVIDVMGLCGYVSLLCKRSRVCVFKKISCCHVIQIVPKRQILSIGIPEMFHFSRLPIADRALLMVICLHLPSGKEPGLVTFATMVDAFRPISTIKISL